MPVFDPLVAEYRYFVADFLSNSVIAELPFKGVSYERALNGAGSFSGAIPVIDKTMAYNLYEYTMPGKTSLYVVRNDECVWGGIIWTRSYSVESRELSVTTTEFTSYLHHRNVWKTFNNKYSASATVTVSGRVDVTLSNVSYNFTAGAPVYLTFSTVGTEIYNGKVTVAASPAPSSTTFSAQVTDGSGNPIPPGSYGTITVEVRVDTYDYMRSLIKAALNDFIDIRFPNNEIEPGKKIITNVISKSLNNNVATLTAFGHSAQVGQSIEVNGVGDPFNGSYEVSETTQFTVSYSRTASNVAPTAVLAIGSQVSAYSASDPNNEFFPSAQDYAYIMTATPHGLAIGDLVNVVGLDNPAWAKNVFNGISRVVTTPSNNSFTFLAKSTDKIDAYWFLFDPPPVGSGVFTLPSMSYGTYGPFPGSADFGLDFSTNDYSGQTHLAGSENTTIIRGFELRSIGEELDEYSDSLSGFEYRIDCDYDTATSSFTRTFVFVPINDFAPVPAGEIPPLERYGAQNFVFEYPGNVSNVTLDESAESAATRFFVVGSDNNLGNDASQPYSVASATDLLAEGWPLLDVDESRSGVYNEDDLYEHADRYLSEFRPPIGDMKVSVNGSLQPTIGTYKPGDWCSLIINDDFVRYRLATNLEPRTDIIVRKINGFKVSVPDNPSFPEQVELDLIQEWEIDQVG